jgi:flagellar basal-body rod protein FlgB
MVKTPPIARYLEAALRATGLRQAVIASNIANLNTPGYRRHDVAFRQRLAEAIAAGEPPEPGRLELNVHQPRDTPLNARGNDVDLEKEIGEMLKNAGAYKMYVRLLSKLYQQMELAIGVR